jgi:hypothetical protein
MSKLDLADLYEMEQARQPACIRALYEAPDYEARKDRRKAESALTAAVCFGGVGLVLLCCLVAELCGRWWPAVGWKP